MSHADATASATEARSRPTARAAAGLVILFETATTAAFVAVLVAMAGWQASPAWLLAPLAPGAATLLAERRRRDGAGETR